MSQALRQDWSAVDAAFSRQSQNYDHGDEVNCILQDWRQKVYRHVDRYLEPSARIIELNAGTGIDALYFAENGHEVLATDIASGMVSQMERKIKERGLQEHLHARQCSFMELEQLAGEGQFDYAFSNFGGLNCLDDLRELRRSLKNLLHPGAMLTFVIMPPFCPWEMISGIKGNVHAFRRLTQGGTRAQLEGYEFKTYYHSVRSVKNALGIDFKLISCESLGLFSPPPSADDIATRHPKIFRALMAIDNACGQIYPFSHWGDHVIITMRREK